MLTVFVGFQRQLLHVLQAQPLSVAGLSLGTHASLKSELRCSNLAHLRTAQAGN